MLGFVTALVGAEPAGIESAFALPLPLLDIDQAALAAWTRTSATNAASRTVKNLFGLIAQLVAASVIGTLKTAPWQVLSEAFDIATLPATENVTVAPAPTAWLRPVVFVKVTPVDASHAAPLSEVIAPAPVTEVTVTANGFEFVTLIQMSPVPPGYSWALVEAEASDRVRLNATFAFE